jgi:hypothetical protein
MGVVDERLHRRPASNADQTIEHNRAVHPLLQTPGSRRGRHLSCLLFASSVALPEPSEAAPISVDCGHNSGTHYAGQVTSTTRVVTHSRGDIAQYYGWAGINGLMFTPSTNTPMDHAQTQDALGWFGMYGSDKISWLEVGWYRGALGRWGQGQCAGATGTNNTLCLLGATGYQDWDRSLTSGTTSQFDEQPASGPQCYLTVLNQYYFVRATGVG